MLVSLNGWALTEFRGTLGIEPDLLPTKDIFSFDANSETQEPAIHARSPADNQSPAYYVVLKGKYLEKDGYLVQGQEKIILASDGSFALEVGISSSSNPFSLNLVNKEGILKPIHANVQLSNWDEFLQTQIPERLFQFSGGVGFSSILYRQSFNPDISFLSITPSLSARLTLPNQRWSMEASSYYTLVPFLINPTGTSMQIFGVSLTAAYHFLFSTLPRWKFTLAGGGYYITSFTSSFTYGFGNIQGPQLYPEIEYQVSQRGAISAYFKYSPILNYSSFLPWRNANIGFGCGYTFLNSIQRPRMSVELDVSLLSFQFSISNIYLSTSNLSFVYHL
jgi:hypothetical protein